MKKRFLLVVLCFVTVFSFAQKNAIIKFDTTTYDFGKIKEEDGFAAHTFFFSNEGTDTLKLTNVKPGCGCTTADWSKGPILPGQKGYIKAEYNPKSRTGVFSKAITVTSNATVPTQVLIIKGEVIGRKKDYTDTFSVKSGNLRLKSNHIAFMNIINNEIKTDTLEIMNDWYKPISLKVREQLKNAICVITPEILNPKERGMIILTYDASKRNEWGLTYDYISIVTNDSVEPSKTITISANIMEDFSKLTAKQKANAPKIVFANDTLDFGTIKQGDTVRYKFTFKNEGKSNMIIHRVKSSCGCTATKVVTDSPIKDNGKFPPNVDPYYIYPKGKGGYIETVFVSWGRKGDQNKTITVITNDPANPVITLTVMGKVTD